MDKKKKKNKEKQDVNVIFYNLIFIIFIIYNLFSNLKIKNFINIKYFNKEIKLNLKQNEYMLWR